MVVQAGAKMAPFFAATDKNHSGMRILGESGVALLLVGHTDKCITFE